MLCCWGEGRRRRVGADDAQGKVEAGRVGCVASALTGFSAASEVVRLPLRLFTSKHQHHHLPRALRTPIQHLLLALRFCTSDTFTGLS
jgi:hypothetical protein